MKAGFAVAGSECDTLKVLTRDIRGVYTEAVFSLRRGELVSRVLSIEIPECFYNHFGSEVHHKTATKFLERFLGAVILSGVYPSLLSLDDRFDSILEDVMQSETGHSMLLRLRAIEVYSQRRGYHLVFRPLQEVVEEVILGGFVDRETYIALVRLIKGNTIYRLAPMVEKLWERVPEPSLESLDWNNRSDSYRAMIASRFSKSKIPPISVYAVDAMSLDARVHFVEFYMCMIVAGKYDRSLDSVQQVCDMVSKVLADSLGSQSLSSQINFLDTLREFLVTSFPISPSRCEKTLYDVLRIADSTAEDGSATTLYYRDFFGRTVSEVFRMYGKLALEMREGICKVQSIHQHPEHFFRKFSDFISFVQIMYRRKKHRDKYSQSLAEYINNLDGSAFTFTPGRTQVTLTAKKVGKDFVSVLASVARNIKNDLMLDLVCIRLGISDQRIRPNVSRIKEVLAEDRGLLILYFDNALYFSGEAWTDSTKELFGSSLATSYLQRNIKYLSKFAKFSGNIESLLRSVAERPSASSISIYYHLHAANLVSYAEASMFIFKFADKFCSTGSFFVDSPKETIEQFLRLFAGALRVSTPLLPSKKVTKTLIGVGIPEDIAVLLSCFIKDPNQAVNYYFSFGGIDSPESTLRSKLEHESSGVVTYLLLERCATAVLQYLDRNENLEAVGLFLDSLFENTKGELKKVKGKIYEKIFRNDPAMLIHRLGLTSAEFFSEGFRKRFTKYFDDFQSEIFGSDDFERKVLVSLLAWKYYEESRIVLLYIFRTNLLSTDLADSPKIDSAVWRQYIDLMARILAYLESDRGHEISARLSIINGIESFVLQFIEKAKEPIPFIEDVSRVLLALLECNVRDDPAYIRNRMLALSMEYRYKDLLNEFDLRLLPGKSSGESESALWIDRPQLLPASIDGKLVANFVRIRTTVEKKMALLLKPIEYRKKEVKPDMMVVRNLLQIRALLSHQVISPRSLVRCKVIEDIPRILSFVGAEHLFPKQGVCVLDSFDLFSYRLSDALGAILRVQGIPHFAVVRLLRDTVMRPDVSCAVLRLNGGELVKFCSENVSSLQGLVSVQGDIRGESHESLPDWSIWGFLSLCLASLSPHFFSVRHALNPNAESAREAKDTTSTGKKLRISMEPPSKLVDYSHFIKTEKDEGFSILKDNLDLIWIFFSPNLLVLPYMVPVFEYILNRNREISNLFWKVVVLESIPRGRTDILKGVLVFLRNTRERLVNLNREIISGLLQIFIESRNPDYLSTFLKIVRNRGYRVNSSISELESIERLLNDHNEFRVYLNYLADKEVVALLAERRIQSAMDKISTFLSDKVGDIYELLEELEYWIPVFNKKKDRDSRVPWEETRLWKQIKELTEYMNSVIPDSRTINMDELIERLPKGLPSELAASHMYKEVYIRILENFFILTVRADFFTEAEGLSVVNELVRANHRFFEWITNKKGPRRKLSRLTFLENAGLKFEDRVRTLYHELGRIRSGGYIRLNLRRQFLVYDTYKALILENGNSSNLSGGISVNYVGEYGADAGGLTRDFYSSIARDMFNTAYSYFRDVYKGLYFDPRSLTAESMDDGRSEVVPLRDFYKLCGILLGRALLDRIQIDTNFAVLVYKILLYDYAGIRYSDLQIVDQEVFESFEYIRSLKSEEEIEDLMLDFTVTRKEFGVSKVIELVEGGRDIAVTKHNVLEYLEMSTRYILYDSVKIQIESFREGFYMVVPQHLVLPFNEKELGLLIGGTPEIDIEDLKENTAYKGGYEETSRTIMNLWRLLEESDNTFRAKFLQFCTGSTRVPNGGFANLRGINRAQPLTIKRLGSTNRLPTAHTCFNTLDLPDYETFRDLRIKLTLAVNETEGFGFA